MVTIGTSAAVSVIILILLQFHALERFPRLALPGEAVIAMCAGLIWRILVGRLLSNTTRPFQPWSPTQLKTWLMTGVRYFAPVGIVLSVYMGINWFLFGTPSPVSGQIKRWWGTLMTVYGKPETSLAGLFGFSPNADLSPWTLFTRIPYQVAELSGNLVQMNEESQLWVVGLSTFVLLFLVFLLLRLDKDLSKRTIDGWNLVPLLVGGFLQMFNYKVSGYVSLHAWYWIAQMMLLVLLYGLMLDSVFVRIRKSVKPSILVNALALFCATALVLANLSWLNQLTPWKVPKGQEEGYLWGARGLEENTPEGSLIGSTGGGVLGYFTHGRTIVNMDGLISSFDYFKKLKAGIAAEHLDSIGLDYVYAGEWVLIYSEPYTDMFEGRLRYIDKVVGTDLYEYLPGK
jgi:hypothetical protein